MNRFLERLIEHALQSALAHRSTRGGQAALERAWKIDEASRLVRPQKTEALHRVPKLSDVARPSVRLERRERRASELRRPHAMEPRELRDELVCERRDVRGTIAERRNVQGDPFDSVIEIGSESPCLDVELEGAERRTNEARIGSRTVHNMHEMCSPSQF
jgi:hypothetical protein